MWAASNEPVDPESLSSAEPPFSVETALRALFEEFSLPLSEGPLAAFPKGVVLIFLTIYLHHLSLFTDSCPKGEVLTPKAWSIRRYNIHQNNHMILPTETWENI